MKRRQKPIILITVIVICAGLVFIMSTPHSSHPDAPNAPTPGAAPPTGQNTPTTTQAGIAQQVSSSMNQGPAGKPKPKGMGPMGMSMDKMPKQPSIMTEKEATFSPTPSDTNVNSGWYTNEAPSTYAPPKKK